MAIYHFSAAVVSRSKGQSAINTLAYVLKQREHDDHIDKTFDYSKKQDEVIFRETVMPEQARIRFRNENELWNSIENFEKRGDAQLAQRVNIALPRDLSHEQQIALAQKFARVSTRDGRVFSYGIHDDGSGNSHIDGEYSIRVWDASKNDWGKKSHFDYELDEHGNKILNPKRGAHQPKYLGKKISNIGRDDLLQKRKLWADLANEALKEAGSKERISERTLKAQRKEQERLARKAERDGDLERMLKHDLKAAELDREPTRHEFRMGGQPRSLIKKGNDVIKQKNDQHVKNIKKKKRDEYWRKRHQQDQQRRQHPQRRHAYIRSVADSSLSQSMQTQRRQPDRDLQRLFADSKSAKQREGLQYVFCACKCDAARLLGISTKELDRRAAVDLVEAMEKRTGKRVPYKQRNALIKRLQDAHSRQDGICVVTKPAKTAGKAANTAIKASVTMVQATEQMIEAVRGLVGAIPLIGKPLSGALGIAEAPLKATRKIGDAITKRADKILGDERRDQRQRGIQQGRKDGGRQQQQQEQKQDERGGGLPASAADTDRKERNNGLDDWKLLSKAARADIEMEDFLAEVFGGGGRSRD